MKSKKYFKLIFVSLFFWGGIAGNRGAVYKILFMGDSITLGKNCIPGFRDDVYYGLQNLGIPFEFVGSVNETPPFRGFYFNSAYTTDFFEKKGAHYATAELDYWKPNIVVIHLGTNDFWLYSWIAGGPYTDDGGQTFTVHVSGNIASLLAYLMQWHDGRRGAHLNKVFLCQIIPKTWRHMGPTGIPMLNQDLVQLVNDIDQGLVPSISPGWVSLVDQFTTFTGDMFSDDNHPNCNGYRHMGQIFIDAFKTLPMHLKADSTGDHLALPGQSLSSPIIFQVTDGYGNPVPNMAVDFKIAWGDATLLSPSTAVSDSNGQVKAELCMGWADSSVVQAHALGLVDSMITFTVYPKEHVYLSGQCVYYGNENPVDSVKIRWEDTGQPAYSNEAGFFKIDGIPLFESVNLIPERSAVWEEQINVSLYGAALIARYVSGIQTFSDEQELAADINGDDAVTLQDAVLIARIQVGLESAINTKIGEWKFLPQSLKVDSVSVDVDSLDFTAVRVGDFIPVSQDENNDGALFVEKGEERFLGKRSQAVKSIKIPIWLRGEDVLACQMTVAWDTSRVIWNGIEQSLPGFVMAYNQIQPGKLRIAMFSSEAVSGEASLFTLAFWPKGENTVCDLTIQDAVLNNVPLLNSTKVMDDSMIKKDFGLENNYPNPFNAQTHIPYSLKNAGHVQVIIYNVCGQMIRNLMNDYINAGTHELLWDGKDQLGMDVSSGIYLIVIENEHEKYVKRMELLR